MTRQIFISHTTEFSEYPEDRTFIDAAIAAIIRAWHVPCDMRYFAARDQKPAEYCKQRVKDCDVYVGLIGLRYGSLVRDRPELSYTELEFEAASEFPQKTRLVFMLDPMALVPPKLFSDHNNGDKQDTFRNHLNDAGITCITFREVHELEKLIYQALMETFPLSAGTPQIKPLEWPEGKSPYPGLEWFDPEYATLYCGRDREIDEVIAKMVNPKNRFLIIVGASGSGKSSLVGAGVWRALLHEERLPGSRNWRWCRMLPGDGEKTPFQGLAWALKQTFSKITERPDKLAKQLVENPQTLENIVTSQLDEERELVLCLDQMEEFFTRSFKDADIKLILDQLIETSQNHHNHLRVITTLRSDFLPQLQEIDSIVQLINAGSTYHLGPISELALEKMVTKPAECTGYELEPGLVDEILRDAKQEPGQLPLVAYALKQLFELREGRRFTWKAYKSIGGVAGAIGTKADQILKKLDGKAKTSFDRVFSELVHIERDGPPTRRRALLSHTRDHKEANQLIQALAGPECRVLITGHNEQGATVEVAHEKLFTAWPRLKEWIDQSKGDLRNIEHAIEEAWRWRERGERPEELWPVSRAREVWNILRRFGKSPSQEFTRFLNPQSVLIKKLKKEKLSHKERLIIGRKLAEFGDPRPGVGLSKNGLPDIAWIEIPEGQVKLKDFDFMFTVKPFLLAEYPVTNAQFEPFLQAEDGFFNETWWQGFSIPEGLPTKYFDEPNCPRESVSWYEAVAFCRWLSHRSGLSIRLPNEWEWQQAATGGNSSYKYPWGKKFDPTRVHIFEPGSDRTIPVGLYPNGATLQGVMDLMGNVSEWCLNPLYKYINVSSKGPGYPSPNDLKDRAIRGFSYCETRQSMNVSRRIRHDPEQGEIYLGFRLAQDIE